LLRLLVARHCGSAGCAMRMPGGMWNSANRCLKLKRPPYRR
jgi:hypothetical protein